MCRSPEALALGPTVISFRRRYHCPSFGCLFNRSRDCRLAFASLRHRRPFSVRELGLRPRAGKGEVPEDPGPAGAVSPTFRADAGPEHSHRRNPLVQAGRSPSASAALALATPVSPTGRAAGARCAVHPSPKRRMIMSAKHAETVIESGSESFIPLNKLKKSPKNARKTPHSEASIEAYAASIAAKGILQNLVVEPELDTDGAATGFYFVTIGEGRRLAQ